MALTERYVTSGAGGGGAGTEGDPWTLSEAFSNAAAGDRVNIKTGTYNESSLTATNAGSETQPIILRGYDTTIGDGNQGRSTDGTLDTSNMPDIVLTGNITLGQGNWILESLDISGTVAGNLINFSTSYGSIVNCNVLQTGTGSGSSRATLLNANNCKIIDCDVVTTQTTTAGAVVVGGAFNTIAACRISATNGDGVLLSQVGESVILCLIYDCVTGITIDDAVGKSGNISYCTVVGCSGDGIQAQNADHDDLFVVHDCLITDNGAYGIDDEYSTATQWLLYNNRFDRNTSGDLNGTGDWPNINANTDSISQANEYVDASTDDYRIKLSSSASNAGSLPNSNIGYYQNPPGQPRLIGSGGLI